MRALRCAFQGRVSLWCQPHFWWQAATGRASSDAHCRQCHNHVVAVAGQLCLGCDSRRAYLRSHARGGTIAALSPAGGAASPVAPESARRSVRISPTPAPPSAPAPAASGRDFGMRLRAQTAAAARAASSASSGASCGRWARSAASSTASASPSASSSRVGKPCKEGKPTATKRAVVTRTRPAALAAKAGKRSAVHPVLPESTAQAKKAKADGKAGKSRLGTR